MTKKQEAKLIAEYREFLKLNPIEYKPIPNMKGYMGVSETDMQEKDAEFLKHIGYEGDATDFYWEHGTHLLTIRLKAMDR